MRFSLPKRAANRIKALIMIFTAIYLTQLYVSGDLYYYIGPRFGWLSIVGVILLIILAGSYNLVEKDETPSDEETIGLTGYGEQAGRERTSVFTLFVMALPLLLGVIVPAQPLNANAISGRGINTSMVAASDSETALSAVPGERNVLDWVRAMGSNPDPAALTGQEADMIGFVYRDIRFEEDQFMVARFTLSCCVADATAIGVVVQTENAEEFPTDSWVRVTGTFEAGTLDGSGLPVLIADEITPVERPEQPYLFQ
jgi:uncharacterized repeat protein (TIGR03943 family)